MKLLLIGGTGVLSSAVTEEALKRGYEVTMINRGNKPIPQSVHFFKSNNKDYSLIASFLKGKFYDAIIDFLCYTDKELQESFELYHSYTAQYFFISSGAVYNTLKSGPYSEDAPKVLDIWPYSVNKWKCECLLVDLASKTNCNYTIIRPGVTYGNTRIPYGISPRYGYHWTMCARILAGKPLISWKGGMIKSSVMRVEDFAFQMLGLVGNKNAYNEAFNISGNESPSSNDILKEISSVLGKECITVDIASEFYAVEYPSRYGEIIGGRSNDSPLDNSKINSIVPMDHQMISLHDGIKMTIDFYKINGYQHGIDWTFDADTDRIVKRWCKKQGIDEKQYKLEFVDYLGTATKQDKMKYWVTIHQDNLIVKTGVKIIKLPQRVLGKFKRIIKTILR